MKWFIFRYTICILVLIVLGCSKTMGQDSRYDKNLNRYRQKWERLIPTQSKIQFAGNMGLISIGTGWDYGKKDQWESDLFLGFIPKLSSKRAKITMTLKQNYIPFNINLKGRFSIQPLICGLYFNTVFGNEFWVSEPERYPRGYYGFSSKIRTHIFVGQQISYDIAPKFRIHAREISLYYEISTYDLILISAVTNKYLTPKDYLSLSIGIKMQIF